MDRIHWTKVGENLEPFKRNWVWREHADAVNRAALVRWLPAARWDRVLKTDIFDEAVGEGVCALLSAHATTVAGMDLSLAALRHARHSGVSPALVCADVRKLPLAGGACDAIVSLSTLDHFPSLDEVRASLLEMHRVLKPGGRLLITMDNLANPVVWIRNHLPSAPLLGSGVVPYYVGATCGPSGLRRLLEQAGFRVLDRRAILHCPRLAAVPLGRLVSLRRAPALGRLFLGLLMAFENLGRLPTRWLTGHFVAVLAAKESA